MFLYIHLANRRIKRLKQETSMIVQISIRFMLVLVAIYKKAKKNIITSHHITHATVYDPLFSLSLSLCSELEIDLISILTESIHSKFMLSNCTCVCLVHLPKIKIKIKILLFTLTQMGNKYTNMIKRCRLSVLIHTHTFIRQMMNLHEIEQRELDWSIFMMAFKKKIDKKIQSSIIRTGVIRFLFL